ncbi:hypothetical protein RJT34_01543 [Clitoria ternatea]|uniref:Uncharacterized protein n=1 Tax=Clitoria ternatea TaxID=43366 RepID=A0AAN9KJG3_CLITE
MKIGEDGHGLKNFKDLSLPKQLPEACEVLVCSFQARNRNSYVKRYCTISLVQIQGTTSPSISITYLHYGYDISVVEELVSFLPQFLAPLFLICCIAKDLSF